MSDAKKRLERLAKDLDESNDPKVKRAAGELRSIANGLGKERDPEADVRRETIGMPSGKPKSSILE